MSAQSAPFFVAPNESTSAPARHDISAGDAPVAATALLAIVGAAIASAFPAMPLITGKTSTSVSNSSQQRARTRAVTSSPPYEVIAPALTRSTASAISGEAGRTLSERKSFVTAPSYHGGAAR